MASELIADDPVANRSRLSEAAGHFWSATFDEENWPLSLRVASTSLKAKLLAKGTIIGTVQSLNPKRTQTLADELSHFCIEACDHLTTDRCRTMHEPYLLRTNRVGTGMPVLPKS